MPPSELMGQKQCSKCGETVEEAKAFCPGCGHAFVEEKTRESASDFDLSAHTVRLGDTMYNQMLSDMGLNISKQPNTETPQVQSISPAVQVPQPAPPNQSAPPSQAKPSRLKWILIGIAAAVFFLAVLVILAAVAIILYSR
jgi:hypothetical protein